LQQPPPPPQQQQQQQQTGIRTFKIDLYNTKKTTTKNDRK
jgi:hypothetical protein